MKNRKFGWVKRFRQTRFLRASGWRRNPSSSPENLAKSKTGLLFASYNIHKAVGRDGLFDPKRIIAVIKEIGPDVIALQEADRRHGDRGAILDLALIERETGLRPAPVETKFKGNGWHGNIVLFRRTLVISTIRQIVLPGFEPRGALVVDLFFENEPIRVIATHLGLLRRSRSKQFRAIIDASKPIDGRPVIIMGDFNEWRIGKKSTLHGLSPNFGPVHAPIPSFPARFPLLALDRIVAMPAEIISRLDLHDTPLSKIASDHMPIKAAVSLAREL